MHLTRTYLALALLSASVACTRNSANTERADPDAPGAVPTAAPLNISTLVGRNIDQLRRQLGPPQETKDQPIGLEPTAEQMRATKGQDWVNTFDKNGQTIVVTFNARTRQVRDMVLLGTDEAALTRRAGLDLVSDQYMVVPVMNPNSPSTLMGVRVVARAK